MSHNLAFGASKSHSGCHRDERDNLSHKRWSSEAIRIILGDRQQWVLASVPIQGSVPGVYW